MRTYQLRGLAEGIVGQSSVQAPSVEALFSSYPALGDVRHKLTIDGNTVTGYAACDG